MSSFQALQVRSDRIRPDRRVSPRFGIFVPGFSAGGSDTHFTMFCSVWVEHTAGDDATATDVSKVRTDGAKRFARR